MVRRDTKIEKVIQRVDEDFRGDFKQFPSQIRQWFTDNIFKRVFSYLIAFTEEGKAVKLQATKAGVLKTATAGSGLEFVEVRTGIAGTTEAAIINFSRPVSRIRFVSVDFNMLFRPSRDGVHFQDQIFVFSGRDFQLDLVVKAFKVQRADVNPATYRIEGYR